MQPLVLCLFFQRTFPFGAIRLYQSISLSFASIKKKECFFNGKRAELLRYYSFMLWKFHFRWQGDIALVNGVIENHQPQRIIIMLCAIDVNSILLDITIVNSMLLENISGFIHQKIRLIGINTWAISAKAYTGGSCAKLRISKGFRKC